MAKPSTPALKKRNSKRSSRKCPDQTGTPIILQESGAKRHPDHPARVRSEAEDLEELIAGALQCPVSVKSTQYKRWCVPRKTAAAAAARVPWYPQPLFKDLRIALRLRPSTSLRCAQDCAQAMLRTLEGGFALIAQFEFLDRMPVGYRAFCFNDCEGGYIGGKGEVGI
jgi:hypothetical protein